MDLDAVMKELREKGHEPSPTMVEAALVVMALKEVIVDAHKATADLKQAVKEAKEEWRQMGRAEARKYLANQMARAAEILRGIEKA